MLQMNLLQTSVEDLVVTALTRASWSRRMCFVEEEGETVVGKYIGLLPKQRRRA